MEAKSINITIILQDIRHTTLENLVKVVKVQYENIILQIEVNNLGVYSVRAWTVLFAQLEWLLISGPIQNVFPFCFGYTDENLFFLLNESVVAPDTKKASKFTCNYV